ncbi:MAG: hypothetical protein WA814_04295 [Candidatus Baltobacteraceae bacterium]
MSPLARVPALTIIALILAGCASLPNGPSTPSAAPDGVDSRGADLLYVSDTGTGDLYVYTYPQGKLQQTIRGLTPEGLCVDGAGDVFVANLLGHDLLEYAHGGTKPIATLRDGSNFPNACAVDAKTGNLAAVNVSSPEISIFVSAKGQPVVHRDRKMQFAYCGYDDKGNLYADGWGARGTFALAELSYGARHFKSIDLDQKLHWPGGVFWDGTSLDVSDQGINGHETVIYEFSISGDRATKVGETKLSTSLDVSQFWIDGGRAAGPDGGRESGNTVKFWSYPGGGSPERTLGYFDEPAGAAISKKPRM